MPGDEKVVTTKLGEDLLGRLDAAAERIDRTRSWVVREALAEWLSEEERRHHLTLEALADVDAGRVHSQTEIDTWASKRRKARAKAAA